MGKPGTIIGAGGRAGTSRPQMQLLETLGETGTIVMVKPGVMVSAFAPDTFDSDGNLINPQMRELLGKHMDEFAKWISGSAPSISFPSPARWILRLRPGKNMTNGLRLGRVPH